MGINEYLQIGTRMKTYRKNAGYTQRQMADLLKLPYSTYSNYENNYREPSGDVIDAFCDSLGIDFPSLMGVGEPEPCYDEIAQLIARNSKNYTTDQKLKLIKLLSETD